MAKTTTTQQTSRPTTGNVNTKTTGNNPPPTVINALQHIEIVVPDAPKTRKFFEKTFGWKFETAKMPTGDYHMFRTPNGNGGGILEPTEADQPVATTPYVSVENCEATLKACEKAGCEIVTPVTEVPGMGKFFIFTYEGCPPIGCWQNTTNNTNNPSRN